MITSKVERRVRKPKPIRTPRAFKQVEGLELEQDICTINLQDYGDRMSGQLHRALLLTTNTLYLSRRKYKKGTQAMPILTGSFPVMDYCPFESDWERVWCVTEGETAREFSKVADEVRLFTFFNILEIYF